MRKVFLWICPLLLAFVSCEVQSSDGLSNDDLQAVIVNLPECDEFETKSTFIIDASGVKVQWADNDTLGIFPQSGDQVYFPMISGAGSSSANFDGGGWGLKSTKTYAAYFPFSTEYYSKPHDQVRLDYSGQVQNGSSSFSHLSSVDFLASGQASPSSGYLTLNMTRLGAIACFRLVVPSAGKYTSAVLSSDADFVIEADLDITGDSPVVTPVRTSHQLTLSLENFETTQDNETVVLYMMISPIDLTSCNSFDISLYGDHTYYSTLPKKNMLAGKPYMFVGGSAVEAISFADSKVKKICLQNWDSDGNGELDYSEAASVTSIDQNSGFRGTSISTFNELQYFTSLTTIGNDAFNNCTSLKAITLPENTFAIGDRAFMNCSKLAADMTCELIEIGTNAFENCQKITGTITLTGIETIPRSAFHYCSSLTNIVLPQSLKTISDDAFSGCSRITEFNLPSGLEYIGSYAFTDCRSITSLNIPEGVVAGPYGLFSNCTSLTSISLPSSWTVFGDAFFKGCTSLVTFTVPDGIVSLGGSCFEDCTSLRSINLPESLTQIVENCFQRCSSLESIVIPSKVKALSHNTFTQCSSLSSVTLPEGLVSIANDGRYCFNDCTSLKQIQLPSTLKYLGTYAFISAGLTSIVIPDSVEVIGFAAFERCYDMTSITLPSHLKLIDMGLFTYTSLESLEIPASVELILEANIPSSVTRIVVNGQTPPTLFSKKCIPDNGCPILVPVASVNDYKTAPVWSEFASRIQALSDGDVNNPQPGDWE